MFFIVMILVLPSSCEKDDNKNLPLLSTTTPYDIDAESAISGGDIRSDGGFPIIVRGVCWDTISPPTIAGNKTEDGAGTGIFTSNITDLEPGKTYYVRAYATNSDGTGYGNEESFSSAAREGVFVDSRDGNSYESVIIGNQVWMAENLRYLPEVHTNSEFEERTLPGYGVYGYNGNNVDEAKSNANYSTFGVVYNWTAAVNACPTGWHLPSEGEWMELENFIKNDELVVPGMEGNALKATYGWNCGVPGTDNYGFTALAGGVRGSNGMYFDAGLYSNWWTNTEAGFPNGANYRALVCTYGLMDKGATVKFAGYYVRCVKD
jgi:uncharacterized protein (TIGR02145 family)